MLAGSALTEADVAVLDCLVDGDEPTTQVVDMLSDDGTEQPAPGEVERRLSVPEARGLVSRSRAWGADAKRDLYEDDWVAGHRGRMVGVGAQRRVQRGARRRAGERPTAGSPRRRAAVGGRPPHRRRADGRAQG